MSTLPCALGAEVVAAPSSGALLRAGWRRDGVLSGRGSEVEWVGEGADGVKSLGCPFFFLIKCGG